MTVINDGNGNDWVYTYNSWGLQEDTIEPSTSAHPALTDRSYTMTFDEGGLPLVEELPGGVQVHSVYDELGRRTQLHNGAGLTETTTYDAVGRLIAASHPMTPITFTYDDLGQLVGTDGPVNTVYDYCLLYTSPSPRDRTRSRMPSSA